MKLKLLLINALFLCIITNAQVTLIPDQNFEQTLIDQNIDSDGIINGQVFTSDIDNINDLNFGFNFITDLTGLEDFAQLQNLTLDNLDLSNSSSNLTLDLTANTMLETLTMNGGDDAFTHFVEQIDLSENPNINLIQTPGIWLLKQIDLKTGTTDVSNLSIDISISPLALMEQSADSNNDDLFCIKVTDATAATAGTGVYSTWTISANNNPYFFSETCTLNTESFKLESVSIYPNPTSDIINIKANNIQFKSVKIFSLQGQLVKFFNNLETQNLDVSDLANGLYVMSLTSDNSIIRRKFVKQ
ncbi:T9SS type A sorting domain-containing protein [Flavobacterium sp. CS20]|jgi:hypothetical protein|uniref:T9SS type A sorting domain-containing protein n=1 Tax=Flavobacterium sp. CS20 TaxID=2775246 RepID=UPI001B3A275C|nr:T9SS type A sorting domain-containing protein [Flavobacterium sp. CS20]QTY26586.1 T9SS type A sorting domain-containing protein [Flavobacterium sp. CS20]